MKPIDVEGIEINLLLDAVLRVYGYDFRHYARASLKRRLSNVSKKTDCRNYSQLQEKLIHDEDVFNLFLYEMSITVTEMFRDPHFYVVLRKKVLPILKTYPFVKIWHAGCATGEEVYSMAILLHEEGYLDKATIYATDFNSHALRKAAEGIYSSDVTKQYIKNYTEAGGKSSFADYYRSDYGSIKMKSFLKKNITFANHNLVTDKVFGEMNIILCRNVLIYFNAELQDRVYNIFSMSLCHRGFLCLGTKETLDFSCVAADFDNVSKREKIYRKK